MGRKRDRPPPQERLTPTHTVAHLTDDFIDQLNIPELPGNIPARLEVAIRKRVNALLYQLREVTGDRLVRPFEMRLVRDAHRAVLTAYELKLSDAEVLYASFRRLAEELGYERAEVGFRKDPPPFKKR